MDSNNNVAYTQCRSCSSSDLSTIADFGSVPLASSLVSKEQNADSQFSEETYPLHCVVCNDCTLMQLDYDVNSHDIFIENYHYRASFSETILEHSKELSQSLIQQYKLGKDDLVVEIGSNDGYFLRWINDGRVRVVGIEPSPGPAYDSIELGIETIQEFFDDFFADNFVKQNGQAKLVYLSNVISHVRNTASVLQGIDTILDNEGVLVIENPWVKDLIDENQFDMIYHEHACYFSCHSLEALLNRVGIYLNDAQYVSDLHGGMLIWHASRKQGRTKELQNYFDIEVKDHINTSQYYLEFASRIASVKGAIAQVVDNVLSSGGKMAAYGAIAKGVTLLGALGLTDKQLAFTVDRNEQKVGNYLPGSRIPVFPVESLVDEQPDVVLMLAWNYKKEIAKQQQEYLNNGGAFLVPIPEIEVIGSAQFIDTKISDLKETV